MANYKADNVILRAMLRTARAALKRIRNYEAGPHLIASHALSVIEERRFAMDKPIEADDDE